MSNETTTTNWDARLEQMLELKRLFSTWNDQEVADNGDAIEPVVRQIAGADANKLMEVQALLTHEITIRNTLQAPVVHAIFDLGRAIGERTAQLPSYTRNP